MKVLSLFDGISCGQMALERAGIPVESYCACEIDKYARMVTQARYPNTQQFGDVRYTVGANYDLIIAGSPCQGFSIAGKQLDFADARSQLFFYFLAILKQTLRVNPNAKFLLENVWMKQYCQDIISYYLGVQPVVINSSLVSAQNRKRLYWTNIPGVCQPVDRGLLIGDILEDKGIPVIKSHGTYCLRAEKAMCIDANYWKGPDNHGQRTIILEHDGCNELCKANVKGHDFLKRVYSIWGKCPTLTAICGGNQERKIAIDGQVWRKLTPTECERLQTIPDNYTLVPNGIGTRMMSNSARYKMLGNGWTVDIIAHIFKGLHYE